MRKKILMVILRCSKHLLLGIKVRKRVRKLLTSGLNYEVESEKHILMENPIDSKRFNFYFMTILIRTGTCEREVFQT